MTSELQKKKILWADDEIDLLRPHILFLEDHGYQVETVTNGDDAVERAGREDFELVLLDEMMPGRDGLDTLTAIKQKKPSLPVIMITKNEEERLMEQALGRHIADYLTKPVNPSQILSAVKRILEAPRIRRNQLAGRYHQEFLELSELLSTSTSWEDWVELYTRLSLWRLELEENQESELLEMQSQQEMEADQAFARFVSSNYERWVSAPPDERPPLSPDIFSQRVAPKLKAGSKVLLLVMDCLRFDQWLTLESVLQDQCYIQRTAYFSLLPTLTNFCRTALFSGLFPDDMQRLYPEWWGDLEGSQATRHELDFLREQLKRLGLEKTPLRLEKVFTNREGQQLIHRFPSWQTQQLIVVIAGQIDLLTHKRTDSEVLQELLPDETGYRHVIRAWFEHSWLAELIRMAGEMGYVVIVTTDHGNVQVTEPTMIRADKEVSPNLRFKRGRNLSVSPRDAWFVRDPGRLRLPAHNPSETLALALSRYFFLFPTNLRQYQQKFVGTYQHGGLSIWEMIVPLAVLKSKSLP